MTPRLIVLGVSVIAASLAVSLPAAGQSAGRTQTVRFFDEPVSMKLTHADGTSVAGAPFPEPKPGDSLDINSLVYLGNHLHHAAKWAGTTHLRCVFHSARRRESGESRRTGAMPRRDRRFAACLHRQSRHGLERDGDLPGCNGTRDLEQGSRKQRIRRRRPDPARRLEVRPQHVRSSGEQSVAAVYEATGRAVNLFSYRCMAGSAFSDLGAGPACSC